MFKTEFEIKIGGDIMDSKEQKIVDFLLESANASIKLRIKKEILCNISSTDEQEYIDLIMAEPIIQIIMNSQKENGWIGNGFHGSNINAGQYDNQEAGTKYLAEKGLPQENPVLRKAMNAYVTTELTDLCYRTKGKLIDEFKYAANGQNIIRCACIARAGYEDIIDISPQIQLSLDSFKRVLEVDSVLDISRKIKSCKYRIFNDPEKWPCRYHLDILSHTKSWKTKENVQMLAASIQKLMRTDRQELIGEVPLNWVGHALGCVGAYGEGFSVSTDKSGVHIPSFERLEWLARCGVMPFVPALQKELNYISDTINQNGFCDSAINENEFKDWGTYAGLQLEVDWKTSVRKVCDVTFRALLILHYANLAVY